MIYDAHNHLHFPELSGVDLEKYFQSVAEVAVNGTHPGDWEAVAQMARSYSNSVVPQFGVHPWEVHDLPSDWELSLKARLEEFPRAGVGECGLDKWIKGHDLALQQEVLKAQLRIANDYNRPVTLHCLKAWGSLRELLKEIPLQKGFLLHAYSGPREWIEEFVEMGAYFSFSPYFLHERKAERVEYFRDVPHNRLIVETDAPAMLGPPESWALEQEKFSTMHQHPLNLTQVYECTAKALEISLSDLINCCQENFISLYHA